MDRIFEEMNDRTRFEERMSLAYQQTLDEYQPDQQPHHNFDQRTYRVYGDWLEDLIAHRPDLQERLWEWMMPASDFDPRMRPADLLDYTTLTKRLLASAKMYNIPLF